MHARLCTRLWHERRNTSASEAATRPNGSAQHAPCVQPQHAAHATSVQPAACNNMHARTRARTPHAHAHACTHACAHAFCTARRGCHSCLLYTSPSPRD
eukprot:12098760-Alexandrium_andersonii.AAC.1